MIITTTKHLPSLFASVSKLVPVIVEGVEYYYHPGLQAFIEATTESLKRFTETRLVLVKEDGVEIDKKSLLKIAPAILEAEGKIDDSRALAELVANVKPPFEIVSLGEAMSMIVIDIERRVQDWNRVAQQLRLQKKDEKDIVSVLKSQKKALEEEVNALLEEMQIPDELLKVKKITPKEFISKLENGRHLLEVKGVSLRNVVVEEVEPNKFKVTVKVRVSNDTISSRAAVVLVKEYLASILGELYDETGVKAVIEDAVVEFE